MNTINLLPESLRTEFLYSSAAELIDLVRGDEAFSVIEPLPLVVEKVLAGYTSEESVLAYYNTLIRPALGTERSLQFLLSLLEVPSTLQEWFNADFSLPPYKFSLDFEKYPSTLDVDNLLDLILFVKNERSHLALIRQPEFFQDMLILDVGNTSDHLLSDVSGYLYRGVNVHLHQRHYSTPLSPYGYYDANLDTHPKTAAKVNVLNKSVTSEHFDMTSMLLRSTLAVNYRLSTDKEFSLISSNRAGRSTLHVTSPSNIIHSYPTVQWCSTSLSDTVQLSHNFNFVAVFHLTEYPVELGELILSENLYTEEVKCLQETLHTSSSHPNLATFMKPKFVVDQRVTRHTAEIDFLTNIREFVLDDVTTKLSATPNVLHSVIENLMSHTTERYNFSLLELKSNTNTWELLSSGFSLDSTRFGNNTYNLNGKDTEYQILQSTTIKAVVRVIHSNQGNNWLILSEHGVSTDKFLSHTYVESVDSEHNLAKLSDTYELGAISELYTYLYSISEQVSTGYISGIDLKLLKPIVNGLQKTLITSGSTAVAEIQVRLSDRPPVTFLPFTPTFTSKWSNQIVQHFYTTEQLTDLPYTLSNSWSLDTHNFGSYTNNLSLYSEYKPYGQSITSTRLIRSDLGSYNLTLSEAELSSEYSFPATHYELLRDGNFVRAFSLSEDEQLSSILGSGYTVQSSNIPVSEYSQATTSVIEPYIQANQSSLYTTNGSPLVNKEDDVQVLLSDRPPVTFLPFIQTRITSKWSNQIVQHFYTLEQQLTDLPYTLSNSWSLDTHHFGSYTNNLSLYSEYKPYGQSITSTRFIRSDLGEYNLTLSEAELSSEYSFPATHYELLRDGNFVKAFSLSEDEQLSSILGYTVQSINIPVSEYYSQATTSSVIEPYIQANQSSLYTTNGSLLVNKSDDVQVRLSDHPPVTFLPFIQTFQTSKWSNQIVQHFYTLEQQLTDLPYTLSNSWSLDTHNFGSYTNNLSLYSEYKPYGQSVTSTRLIRSDLGEYSLTLSEAEAELSSEYSFPATHYELLRDGNFVKAFSLSEDEQLSSILGYTVQSINIPVSEYSQATTSVIEPYIQANQSSLYTTNGSLLVNKFDEDLMLGESSLGEGYRVDSHTSLYQGYTDNSYVYNSLTLYSSNSSGTMVYYKLDDAAANLLQTSTETKKLILEETTVNSLQTVSSLVNSQIKRYNLGDQYGTQDSYRVSIKSAHRSE